VKTGSCARDFAEKKSNISKKNLFIYL